jgi:hypothetical protein
MSRGISSGSRSTTQFTREPFDILLCHVVSGFEPNPFTNIRLAIDQRWSSKPGMGTDSIRIPGIPLLVSSPPWLRHPALIGTSPYGDRGGVCSLESSEASTHEYVKYSGTQTNRMNRLNPVRPDIESSSRLWQIVVRVLYTSVVTNC